jgi:hypothetical protein
MLTPSAVRMAQIDLKAMEALANQAEAKLLFPFRLSLCQILPSP